METLASEMLKELKLQAKRWFWAFITVLLLWFATIGIFVWYIQLYDYSSEVVTIESDNTGNANYIGNNGDITNGENSGKEKETN